MFKKIKKLKNPNFMFFLVCFFLFLVIDFNKESDIWFLFSHGRYILSHGFPTHDILSMHSSFSFVCQQWLSSVIFYLVYHYLGNLIFYIFLFSINLVILFLLYKICLTINNGKVLSAVLVSTIIDILLELFFITPRPQIFSYIVFLSLFLILEKYYKDPNYKKIYLLPVLSILLVNLHASMWLCFFVFIAPYLCEYIFCRDKKFFKLLTITIISFIVGFINPYGLKAMFYVVTSYGDAIINILIKEMQSFNLHGGRDVVFNSYLYLFIFFFISSFMFCKKNKSNIHQVILLFGTFCMVLNNFRSGVFFLIFSLPFISKYIRLDFDFDDKLSKIIGLILLIVVLCFCSIKIYTKSYLLTNDNKNVVAYLNKHTNKKIKLYTSFNDGSYYEYYGYKPYIDSRAEVFLEKNNKKEDILLEFYQVTVTSYDYEYFINKYKFDYLVVHDGDNIYTYLDNNNDKFKLVYKDKDIYLFKNKK